jgi:hypothetical protein
MKNHENWNFSVFLTSSLRKKDVRTLRKTMAESNPSDLDPPLGTFAHALPMMIVACNLAREGDSGHDTRAVIHDTEFAEIQYSSNTDFIKSVFSLITPEKHSTTRPMYRGAESPFACGGILKDLIKSNASLRVYR